jgi:uroporphyrinogen-III synthase
MSECYVNRKLMVSLKGKIIIMTQPADQDGEFAESLKSRGAVVYSLPMIKTNTLEVDDVEIDGWLNGEFRLLVFTSKKGVRGFFSNLARYSGGVGLPGSMKIAATGQSTGREVEKYGHEVPFINPGTLATDLAAYLLEEVIRPGDKILLALGTLAPDFLERALSAKAVVRRVNVYETLPVGDVDQEVAGLIRSGKADMCIFTSPSGFHNYLKHFGGHDITFAALGQTTALAISAAGYRTGVISPYPAPEELSRAIEEYFVNN